jgi:hypothetical protein
MIEFLKNIIPRIQKYSKGLDKIEVFVDKTEPWIYVDESGLNHQYIFLRDNRLLMTSNGSTKTGKWELLPTKQLLIDRNSDQIILDHLFVDKALLILKLSGVNERPFILINTEEIPDLDVLAYLKNIEIGSERSTAVYKKPLIEDDTDHIAKVIGYAILGILMLFLIAFFTESI